MEQFRKMGEAMGSMRAQMVLHDESSSQINRRQCCLLYDIFDLAFNTITDEIKQSRLKLDEKKWKALEQPLKEICKVFRDGESYVQVCLELKESSWWAHAMVFHENRDCVEYHIHNLLSYFPTVIEAIENVATTGEEVSGSDLDEMQMRRIMLVKKYDKVWNDPKLFRWNYGKQYLLTDEMVHRLETAWREDRWLLLETVNFRSKRRRLSSHNKYEQRLREILTKKLTGSALVFPSAFLTGGLDFQVKRRLGKGSQYREIHWMGDNFVLRRLNLGVENDTDQTLESDVTQVLSLSHPNVVQYVCGFQDDEKKEYMFIMELMTKDLKTHIKELSGPKKRLPFSLPVAVDIMLQVARGMEFLHSQKIYHGELNPSNILIKLRGNHSSTSSEGYVHAKISGFEFRSLNKCTSVKVSSDESPLSFIWYAPEVLCEQEKLGRVSDSKYSEKADVYSFGMLCFELLTGKVPFEDGHLQGDKMSRNIRAGERPLFPFSLPKCLSTLTKKCWQTNAEERPSFSTICRILRYIRRSMVVNSHLLFPEIPAPQADFIDIDAAVVKKLMSPQRTSTDLRPVWEIPYELFAYRLAEKDKLNGEDHNNNSECEREVSPMPPPTTSRRHHIENTAAAAALSDLEQQQQSPSLKPNDTRFVRSEMAVNNRVSHPPSLKKAQSAVFDDHHDTNVATVTARPNNHLHLSGPLSQQEKKPITRMLKRSVSLSNISTLHSLYPASAAQDSVCCDQIAGRGSPLSKSCMDMGSDRASSDQAVRGSPLRNNSICMGCNQIQEVSEKKPVSPLSKQRSIRASRWSAGMLNAARGAKPQEENKKKDAEKSVSLPGRARHFFWYNKIRKSERC